MGIQEVIYSILQKDIDLLALGYLFIVQCTCTYNLLSL